MKVKNAEEQSLEKMKFVSKFLDNGGELPEDEHHDRNIGDEVKEEPSQPGIVIGECKLKEEEGLEGKVEAGLKDEPLGSVAQHSLIAPEVDQQDNLDHVDQGETDEVGQTVLHWLQEQVDVQGVRNQGHLQLLVYVLLHLHIYVYVKAYKWLQLIEQPHGRQEFRGLPLVYAFVVPSLQFE